MDNIRINGSDKDCEISGEGFSYRFVKGHPVSGVVAGVKQPQTPYPLIGGKAAKSRARIVHKYWDSALVVTEYRRGFKKVKVKYLILSSGEMKIETVFVSKG